MSILEGELAETISGALQDANIPYDVTIHRTETTGGGGPYHDPEETVVDYRCKGFVETFEAEYIAGGLVQSNDVKVVVLANTLSITPTPAENITVRGKTYAILNVSPDPALATIEIQARI